MRGEVCIGAASLLSLAATLLMIFVHVGQINTSTVPREISMAKVNVSTYNESLHSAFTDPISGLYTFDASAPLGRSLGLRQFYEFGLYSHCGYIDGKEGVCGNRTRAEPFTPYDVIRSDMIANYSRITEALLGDVTFRDSGYLAQSTRAAYWMLLLGTICAALAFLTGVLKRSLSFFISTIFSIVATILILIGASIWTVMIHKAEDVNSIMIGPQSNPVPVGIFVSTGSGVFLTWAAFACLMASIAPYMISCCTFRG